MSSTSDRLWPPKTAFLLIFTYLLELTLAIHPQKVLTEESGYGPSIESARANSKYIFNAIHSSVRQWGSSVQHNGMSLFPATVPEGTLLYHGSWSSKAVKGIEWMAFEIQHAELFARGHRTVRSLDGVEEDLSLHPRNQPLDWRLIQDPSQAEEGWTPGYIHVYKTNRQLNLLYVDGMGAAKCGRGTMDTQDRLLLNATFDWFREHERSRALCKLADEWGFEGFIRMEAGFEIIKCNFSTGLDAVSVNRKAGQETAEAIGQWTVIEYIREVSKRYHGNQAGRIVLDYSSMISAYFYPVNISNPDVNTSLPTLAFANPEHLSRIKADLKAIMQKPRANPSINWQEVVDMILTRYSDRLQYMATGLPLDMFLSIINNLLNTFIDYKKAVQIKEVVERCASHFLQSVKPATTQDHLIMAGLQDVTHRLCKTLFDVREVLLEVARDNPKEEKTTSPSTATDLIKDLNSWLDWTDWRFCGSCGYDKVCFIAMFPFGTKDDHFNPRCKSQEELGDSPWDIDNYWRY